MNSRSLNPGLFALAARRKCYVRVLFFIAAIAMASAQQTAQADILYRETFGTATTGGQGPAQGYDWAIHTGATAVNKSASTDTVEAINRTANASKPGTTDAFGNINSGPVIGATPGAYAAGIAFASTAAGTVIFWTPEYPTSSGTGLGIDPTAYPSVKFSWYQGCADTTGNWRLAVKVGGQWYVSQQSFLNTAAVSSAANFAQGGDDGNGGANHGSELKSFLYTTNASAWFLLNFDGGFTMGGTPGTGTGGDGTVLSLGAQPGANLSGTIDAFGMFSETTGGANRRFDTFMIEGIVPSTITTTNVWKGTADGTTWDTTTLNWATTGGVQTNFTHNSFSIFDDTALNNTNINLAITATNGGILVSNSAAHYIISGGGNIVGPGGLTKKSSGTLIIANTISNTFSGAVDLQAGTIQLGNGNADVTAGNLGTGVITNNGVLVVNMGSGGSVRMNNSIYGGGTLANIGNGTLTLGGASAFTSGLSISNGPVRLAAIGAAGTGTLKVNSNAMLVLVGTATLNVPLVVSNGFLGSSGMGTSATGPIYATNDLTFITNTTTTVMIADPQNLTGASSSEVRITGRLRGGGDINVIGDAGHAIDGGAGFRLQGTNSISDFTGTITLSNSVKGELQTIVAGPFSPMGNGKLRMEGGSGASSSFAELNLRNSSGTSTIYGTDVEIIGTGYVSFNAPSAQGSSTMGKLKVGDGQIVGANKNNALFIFPSVDLNGGIATFAPGTVILGGASGPAYISVGTINELVSLSGLTLDGSNSMTLTGDANYTGATYVSNGVMVVNGRILHGSVTVNGDGSTRAGILSGTGAITAPVTIADYGTVQPGISNTVGVLSISNALSLNGGTGLGTNTMKLNRDAAPKSDLIQGVTALTAGGTLNVINVGSALQGGDTFKLYNAGIITGSFTTIVLPPLDAPFFWDTNSLYASGTLSVGPAAAAPTTNATITTVSLSGTNLLIHGTNNNVPNTSFHYAVLSSTNIALPLSNWTPVVTNAFNGDGTFDYTHPINPGTPRQFIDVQAVP
jgi:fibronectin-binding autotransporter adhesin